LFKRKRIFFSSLWKSKCNLNNNVNVINWYVLIFSTCYWTKNLLEDRIICSYHIWSCMEIVLSTCYFPSTGIIFVPNLCISEWRSLLCAYLLSDKKKFKSHNISCKKSCQLCILSVVYLVSCVNENNLHWYCLIRKHILRYSLFISR
jgi:hypothetical protein